MRGIEGWFTEDEGRWYARFARSVSGGVFVEVGCWKGRSTSFVGPVCNAQSTRLVCVDHWAGSHDAMATSYDAELARLDVEATFRANMAALGVKVEILAEPSTVAAARFADGSVDRVFLDGSHDAASVKADLHAWWPKLAPRGVLAGHDYDFKHPELVGAVDSFATAHGQYVRRGPRSIFWLEPSPE